MLMMVNDSWLMMIQKGVCGEKISDSWLMMVGYPGWLQ